ncbi:hypothetical protein Ccrd_000992, partial [Cynara cardunculus var. scolymus]
LFGTNWIRHSNIICNHFANHVILCRHVFNVLMKEDLNEIPSKYICRHWIRDLISFNIRQISWRQGDLNGEVARISYDAHKYLDYIFMSHENDKDKHKETAEKINNMMAELEANAPYQSKLEKNNETIRNFLHVNEPEKVDIYPSSGIYNKGCGTRNGRKQRKRIKRQRDYVEILRRLIIMILATTH